MHITQRDVIAKLMYSDELRYSEIKPKDMTGNQFAYHLDRLIARKLIEKNQNGLYSLTLEGMRRTDHLSQKTMKRAVQPKAASALFAQNSEGEVLLQRRGRMPFGGTWNIPATRVRMKEHPSQAILRAAKRAEVHNVSPVFDRVVSIKMGEQKDDFVSDLILYAFTCENSIPKGYELPSARFMFCHPDNLSEISLFPGVKEFCELLLSGDRAKLNEIQVPLEYEGK